ncbi:MAG: ABC transporter ATP-binding protein [Pseudobdellovibrionaceae bacterium]
MGELLIDVSGVSKKFSKNPKALRSQGLRRMAKLMLGRDMDRSRLLSGEFWALENTSLQVRRGEAVALLGLNGSGKSTLLKIISQLLLPDTGQITLTGKIESLIELGAGFHQGLTGRENILLKAGVRGLNQKQINEYYNRVAEFSELREFLSVPIKNYSSGMIARLGFACAIFGNPDILLVDEVLSVGDFEFRQKCLNYINSIRAQTAIMFVSHSMGQVRLFCQRGIVLSKGHKMIDGSVEQAMDYYLGNQPKIVTRSSGLFGEQYVNAKRIEGLEVKVSTSADARAPAEKTFAASQKIHIHVKFRLSQAVGRLIVGIPIYNSKGECITALASDNQPISFRIDEDGDVRFSVELENSFNDGVYVPVIAIMDSSEYLLRKHLENFRVLPRNARDIGYVRMQHSWLQDL